MGINMNYILDAALIIIFIGTVIAYYKKGFVKSILGLGKLLLSLLLAFTLGRPLGNLLAERFMNDRITDHIFGRLSGLYEAGASSFDLSQLSGKIPPSLVKLAEGCGINMDSYLTAQTDPAAGAEGLRRVCAGIAAPISHFICGILGFIIVFIAAYLLFLLSAFIIEAVVKLPILRGVNKLLGGLLGLICGGINILLFIFAVNLIAYLIGASGGGYWLLEGAEQSYLFKLFGNIRLFFVASA